MKCKVLEGMITEVKPNQVFVFGSNLSGIHGKGAARQAMKFGARRGIGEGLEGNSYALPTVDHGIKRSLTVREIEVHVKRFIKTARSRPDLEFLVTEIGCGLAHHKAQDIAPLFSECTDMENIWLPARFITIMEGSK